MLLAGGQGEDESALALLVDGLTDEASGHLADVFFARGDDAAVRTAESKRHAERLRLHGDNICLPGRFYNSQ